jgi:hypothetical protein
VETGLVIAISSRGVEANGGKLHVRDLPDKGCVFTSDLPGLDLPDHRTALNHQTPIDQTVQSRTA